MSDSEKTTKRSLKSSLKGKDKKKKQKKSNKLKISSDKPSKESSSLTLSVKNRNDIKQCLFHLEKFLSEINTNDLESIINGRNIEKLEKLTEIENIEIDLILGKIYYKILSSENFYTDYFSDHDDNEIKIGMVLTLIEDAIGIIENFEDDIISKENFELKGNIMNLIKFMKINLKDDMDDVSKKKLDNYMNELPNKFYSENYIEIMKYKNKICNNNYELLKNIDNIYDLFSGLESYYEQLNVIESLFNDIEINSELNQDKNNYISVSNKDIKKVKRKKNQEKK
jgi:hypothetical protein